MKTVLITTALLVGLASNAMAESYGKSCTTEPKEKWMTIEAIEKLVKDHGYEVAKSKMKGTCAEVYARDKEQGTRIEFFIDPATGNPVGTNWKNQKSNG
ncbi:PepSY domain-containing protein [Hyphomicrobium sp. 99]|uniref:PepSY domain-containing protein n=1 Tax=Hyphomicrobium sp. 99 TaxID=1163419 RepID=UPI0005F7D079|nr:PepSY domain-containing protein [Hyphomicrobium sp. 99]